MTTPNPARIKLIALWPLWVAIGFPLLLIILNATPLAPNFVFVMVGLPALLLMWCAVGVIALLLAIRRARQRASIQVAINAILPLVIVCVSLHLMAFIHFCNDAGDVVHFLVRCPSYMETVRATQANGQPRLLIFNLGGMIWASRGFVYDESDEVVREPSQQSSGWKTRAQNSELGCGYGAEAFPGRFAFTRHWYLASFGC